MSMTMSLFMDGEDAEVISLQLDLLNTVDVWNGKQSP